MKVEMAGIKPEGSALQRKWPIFECEFCGVLLVWANDDRYPEEDRPWKRRRVEAIPVEPGSRGQVVLWYEVNSEGEPVGKQFFRYVTSCQDYTGSTWNLHVYGCGAKKERSKRR